MRIVRTTEFLHPVLTKCVSRIDKQIITAHQVPMRLFETSRVHDRHEMLIQRGKTKDIMSRHLYNIENDPPLFATAIDYVYYDGKWSWNLRNETVSSWYILFGNLVLDICPELEWAGNNRKSKNYCHFQVRRDILIDNIEAFPCVTP